MRVTVALGLIERQVEIFKKAGQGFQHFAEAFEMGREALALAVEIEKCPQSEAGPPICVVCAGDQNPDTGRFRHDEDCKLGWLTQDP